MIGQHEWFLQHGHVKHHVNHNRWVRLCIVIGIKSVGIIIIIDFCRRCFRWCNHFCRRWFHIWIGNSRERKDNTKVKQSFLSSSSSIRCVNYLLVRYWRWCRLRIECMVFELFGFVTRNENNAKTKWITKTKTEIEWKYYLISDPISEARRIIERACALLIFFMLSLLMDRI